jgi:hypothetical protein
MVIVRRTSKETEKVKIDRNLSQENERVKDKLRKRKSFSRDIKTIKEAKQNRQTIKEAKQNRQTRAFVNDCKERRKYNRDRMRVEDEGRGSFVNRLKLN